jgi:ubiquinone/menaquinone biosynthesis C-methylase UbiE
VTGVAQTPDTAMAPADMARAYEEYRRVCYQQLVAHAATHGLLAAIATPRSLEQIADDIGCRPEHTPRLVALLQALCRAGAATRCPAERYAGTGTRDERPPRHALVEVALGADRVTSFLARDPGPGVIPQLRSAGTHSGWDFDQQVDEWADGFERPYYRYSRSRAATAVARPGDRVLDLGCGPGEGVLDLAGRCGPAGLVLGVDASVPTLRRSRQVTRGRGGVHLVAADLERGLPLATGMGLDAATATGLLHFLRRPATLFAETARVVRPGGRLCLAHTLVRRNSPDREFVELMMLGGRPAATPLPLASLMEMARRHRFRPLRGGFFIGSFAWLLFERGADPPGGMDTDEGFGRPR